MSTTAIPTPDCEMSSYEQFSAIMTELQALHSSPSVERARAQARATMGKEHKATFLREFQTISISGYRQVGKTSWILQHADKDSLVIVHDANMVEDFHTRWIKLLGKPENLPVLMSSTEFSYLYLRVRNTLSEQGRKFKKVFIDDATYVSSNYDREQFYANLTDIVSDDVVFYLLG
jgi:hypothetical protein